MKESTIEKHFVAKVKALGGVAYKFTSPARAAVPDRMFIRQDGIVWFCEFKAAGKKPTPAQEREHTRLREHKVNVFVIDNVIEGKTMIDVMVMGC